MLDIGAIHDRLKAAGIPIEGVSNHDDTLAGISIQFAEGASKEQKVQALEIVKNHDKVQPAKKTIEQRIADLEAWRAQVEDGRK